MARSSRACVVLPAGEESSDSDDNWGAYGESSFGGFSSQCNDFNPSSNQQFEPKYSGGFSDRLVANNSISKPVTHEPEELPAQSPISNGVNIENFRQFVLSNNVEASRQCIELGVDVNMAFKTDWTPLMYAAHFSSDILVKLLLDHGAIVNQGDPSPLMNCCSSNIKSEKTTRCAQLLVDQGAKVDSADRSNMTPLMMACKKGHFGAAEILVKSGAKVNRQDNRGYSALCWACSSGHVGIVKLLVENGADTGMSTIQGATPKDIAESHSDKIIFRYLTSKVDSDEYSTSAAAYNPGVAVSAHITNGDTLASGDFTPPNHSTQTSSAGIQTTSSQLGDLEIFLYGLELSSFISLFQQHNITFSHFMQITDDELIKIGITSVGSRKKILDSIHEVHKKDWEASAIPCYEKVKNGKQLGCAEVASIIANVSNQTAYMKSSIDYIRRQVKLYPNLLQVDKNGRGVHHVRMFLHELETRTDALNTACVDLKSDIESTIESGDSRTVDLVSQRATAKSGSRAALYIAALVSVGLASCGIYTAYKRIRKYLSS